MIAIAAIFQNEARWLAEWIEYHLLVGVDRFYLYNNLSSDDFERVLAPYLQAGLVELVPWPHAMGAEYDAVQCEAYRDALARANGVARWLAFLDIDEFLVPVAEESILSLLEPFEADDAIGGICGAWVFFGTSGCARVPESSLMIERLRLNGGAVCPAGSFPWRDGLFKSVVRPERVDALTSPHFMRYRPGMRHVPLDYCSLQINHYWTRDWEYFLTEKAPRRARWGVSTEESLAIARTMEQETPFATPILRFATPLRQALTVRSAGVAVAPEDHQTTPRPPIAARIQKTFIHHGYERVDWYHWLRDDSRTDARSIAYVVAENAYARDMLRPMEGLVTELRQEMQLRIASEDMSVPVYRDGYWYYHHYARNSEHPVHCRRVGQHAEEQVILDIASLAAGRVSFAVEGLQVTPNNARLVYAEDLSGSRLFTLRVRDLGSGTDLEDEVHGTDGSSVWAADGQSFFYVRCHATTRRTNEVWRHEVGKACTNDVLVYVESDVRFSIAIRRSKSKRYLVITASSLRESEVWLVETRVPGTPPSLVLEREAGHDYRVFDCEQGFLLLTNWLAPNYRVVEVAVSDVAKRSAWRELVPHRENDMIYDIELFERYVVLAQRAGGLRQLRVVQSDGRDDHYIAFDESVFTAVLDDNPEMDTDRLRFYYSSPRTPHSIFEYDMATRQRTLLKRDEMAGGYQPVKYETRRVWAPARDGEQIPVSLMFRGDSPPSPARAVWLRGYGAYGHALEPVFETEHLTLVDRGVTVALAHVRGGSELGRGWHGRGKLKDKQRSFDDFVDVTEFLVSAGYCAPGRVIAAGESAGGLLVATVANQRPELFFGIDAAVPFVDVLTSMLDESLPLTTAEYEEWGDPRESEYFRAILGYSPYENVAPRVYPHMFVTAGLHDMQVPYWEVAKWVAKLRAMKADDNHILFETDIVSGHGGATGRFERFAQTARRYGFWVKLLSLGRNQGANGI